MKRVGECLGELRSDVAGVRQMIKRLAFVEERHFDGPFIGRALAIDLEICVPLRNGNNPPIEVRRETAIDDQLLFTSLLSFLER